MTSPTRLVCPGPEVNAVVTWFPFELLATDGRTPMFRLCSPVSVVVVAAGDRRPRIQTPELL